MSSADAAGTTREERRQGKYAKMNLNEHAKRLD